MKNGDVIGHALLENTIHLIGEGGFERATTKAIVSLGIDDPNIKLNEVHIYRLYGSKELLYAEVFATLDDELFSSVRKWLTSLLESPLPLRERMQRFFMSMWEFLLGSEWRCRTYVRYYYSAYFREQSLRRHRKLVNAQEEYFSQIFKDECDVVSLIHTSFMTIMDFAIRVYNGDLEDNDDNVYHIFNLLYSSMSTYFDPDVLAGSRKGQSGR